jgi:hypothetical protein
MIRLLDAVLLLSPLLAFLALRRFGGPTPRLLAVLALWVVLLAAGLWWYGTDRGGAPDTSYHPAELQGGRITAPSLTAPELSVRP